MPAAEDRNGSQGLNLPMWLANTELFDLWKDLWAPRLQLSEGVLD